MWSIFSFNTASDFWPTGEVINKDLPSTFMYYE